MVTQSTKVTNLNIKGSLCSSDQLFWNKYTTLPSSTWTASAETSSGFA
jgi:hypothetical protein